jgi:hypothetical protein
MPIENEEQYVIYKEAAKRFRNAIGELHPWPDSKVMDLTEIQLSALHSQLSGLENEMRLWEEEKELLQEKEDNAD